MLKRNKKLILWLLASSLLFICSLIPIINGIILKISLNDYESHHLVTTLKVPNNEEDITHVVGKNNQRVGTIQIEHEFVLKKNDSQFARTKNELYELLSKDYEVYTKRYHMAHQTITLEKKKKDDGFTDVYINDESVDMSPLKLNGKAYQHRYEDAALIYQKDKLSEDYILSLLVKDKNYPEQLKLYQIDSQLRDFNMNLTPDFVNRNMDYRTLVDESGIANDYPIQHVKSEFLKLSILFPILTFILSSVLLFLCMIRMYQKQCASKLYNLYKSLFSNI
ncbi:hypothetical protein [Staphylococcus massiliensis]|uniref:Uncharacterized protein n=1 Tax=Staphylococcus massiliensis S46 TaxID=1229783 RepID=K9AWM9_9STAP|nr:hypothetical protein [Staphylococcus massiliensis]EKU50506.1 hypothetical protein C273_00755 [Staphylococcus massiliensis S46]POA00376.1 hypothetical protein CD133_04610 [Staphylococcus massiliensis CCUG 55927]